MAFDHSYCMVPLYRFLPWSFKRDWNVHLHRARRLANQAIQVPEIELSVLFEGTISGLSRETVHFGGSPYFQTNPTPEHKHL